MRPTSLNTTVLTLALGDIVIFIVSLVAALTIRELAVPDASFLFSHTVPFLLLLVAWICIFLIGGMYDQTYLRVKQSIGGILLTLQAIGTGVAVVMFYLLSGLVVTPKTNLALFVIVFTVLIWCWRKAFFTRIKPQDERALFVSNTKKAPEYLTSQNMYGITICDTITWDELESYNYENTDLIICNTSSDVYERHGAYIQDLVFRGIRLLPLDELQEKVTGYVDTKRVRHDWGVEHLKNASRFYLFGKRLLDIFAAIILLLMLATLLPMIAVATLITEKNLDLFFAQKRVGAKGSLFTMYKLRSMRISDSETWSTENHAVITPLGKILRAFRIDELPQAFNILRGEMSLVGPRALMQSEQSEMQSISSLYKLRLFTIPGITGWAQISMDQAPANKSEAMQRLGYDLYYVKHASMLFDILIILKTIKTIILKTGIR